MLSYFSEQLQLAGNASRGLINRVTDVKLLQGDLAEAWREGATDYATVAMKFALNDIMVDRASGRTVEAASGARSPNCGPSCAPMAAIGCFRPASRLDRLVGALPEKGRPNRPWTYSEQEADEFSNWIFPPLILAVLTRLTLRLGGRW